MTAVNMVADFKTREHFLMTVRYLMETKPSHITVRPLVDLFNADSHSSTTTSAKDIHLEPSLHQVTLPKNKKASIFDRRI